MEWFSKRMWMMGLQNVNLSVGIDSIVVSKEAAKKKGLMETCTRHNMGIAAGLLTAGLRQYLSPGSALIFILSTHVFPKMQTRIFVSVFSGLPFPQALSHTSAFQSGPAPLSLCLTILFHPPHPEP